MGIPTCLLNTICLVFSKLHFVLTSTVGYLISPQATLQGRPGKGSVYLLYLIMAQQPLTPQSSGSAWVWRHTTRNENSDVGELIISWVWGLRQVHCYSFWIGRLRYVVRVVYLHFEIRGCDINVSGMIIYVTVYA